MNWVRAHKPIQQAKATLELRQATEERLRDDEGYGILVLWHTLYKKL